MARALPRRDRSRPTPVAEPAPIPAEPPSDLETVAVADREGELVEQE